MSHREEGVNLLPNEGMRVQDEQEIGLSNREVSRTVRNYQNESQSHTYREDKCFQMVLNIVILVFCVLIMLFCYRKIYLAPLPTPITTIIDPQLQLQEQPKQEEQPPLPSVPQVQPFQIQPTIWYYGNYAGELRDFRLLHDNNIRRLANLTNFTFVSLNKLTCQDYLLAPASQIIKTLETSLANHKDRTHLLRMITLFFVLSQHGGIAISDNLLFTEDLTWLTNIRNSSILNGNYDGRKLEVFGFFKPELSSEPIDVEWGKNKWKKVVTFPALQSYFLAAKKDAQFLQELIRRVSQTLINSKALQTAQKQMKLHPSQNLFDYLLQSTAITMLKEKGNDALISYGVAVINENLAPMKMIKQLKMQTFDQTLFFLTHLQLRELEDSFGKFRYFTRLPYQQDFQKYISTIKEDEKLLIKKSFVHTYLLPDHAAYSNRQKEDYNEEAWEKLPKIVWVYSPPGIENSGILDMLMANRIKQAAQQAEFEFREVNDSNIQLYVNKTVWSNIKEATEETSFANARSEMVRLAVLYQNGGVFIDLSIILVQSLDWIQFLGLMPSKNVLDRCSPLPKCLLVWDPFYTHPLAWRLSEQCNTKSVRHPTHHNSFIAAQKNSFLMKEWLEIHLSILPKPYNQILSEFEECGITSFKLTDAKKQQKLAIDSLKCALGGRQKQMEMELEAQGFVNAPNQFYQLWSMNSLNGHDKFTTTNQMWADPTYELTQITVNQLQEARGGLHYFVKMTQEQRKRLEKFLVEHHQNIREHINPESIFAKHVLGRSSFTIVEQKGVLRIKYQFQA